MAAIERLAVHLVTEERLRLQDGRHVDGLVVVVDAGDFQILGAEVGADGAQEIRSARAAEVADDVPAFDADMARVLHNLGEGLHLRQLVVARMLDHAFYGERPLLEIDVGVGNVVIVVGKLLEWSDLAVTVGLRHTVLAE